MTLQNLFNSGLYVLVLAPHSPRTLNLGLGVADRPPDSISAGPSYRHHCACAVRHHCSCGVRQPDRGRLRIPARTRYHGYRFPLGQRS